MVVLSPRVRHPLQENIPPGRMEPHENLSPSTSRHGPVFSPVQLNNKEVGLETGHDDAAELKARRRSRVLEIQRQRLASSPVTETDNSRTKSTPLSSLSNAQVAEHYKNCIKLSAENKINAKNAFGLHLIDYMSELIRKKELNNFQVASSTLDASAKIYAGRVDAVHSDMFKVLGGLGTQKKGGEGAEGAEEGEDEVPGSAKGSPSADDKKRRRKKGTKKIKANVKTITMDSYNLEFEVDPLFKKTSATFDEGGTRGLLLNNLSCLDNRCELVLDSQQTVLDLGPGSPEKRRDIKCKAKGLREVLSRVQTAEVCSAFHDFTFTNWSAENEDLFKSLLEPKKSEHAFDPTADPEPIPDLMDDPMEFDDRGDPGGYSDNESTTSERADVTSLDKEAQLVNTVMESIKQGDIGQLSHVLSSGGNDYSHFSASILNTWAGPGHWKMKAGALIKHKLAAAQNGSDGTDKSKRKRKAPFKVDLEAALDTTALLKESRAATTVKEARLNEYSKSKTTLPADLRVEANEILKRGLKDGLMLQKRRTCSDVEDGVQDYDYDNTNDANNFCAALTETEDEDDGIPCTQDSQDTRDGTTHDFQITNDFDNTNNQTVFGQDSQLNTTGGGVPMSLVEQPRRVNRIQIDYAKTAKKIDVKKLKTSMWQLLSHTEKKDEEKDPAAAPEPPVSTSTAPPSMEGEIKFSRVVEELPQKVSTNMAKNLSTPICFVCLLHLVNEKQLSLEGSEDMTDFTITQG